MKLTRNLTVYIYLCGSLLTIILLFYAVTAVFSNRQSFDFYYYSPLKEKPEKERKQIIIPSGTEPGEIIKKVLNCHLLGPVSMELRNYAPEAASVTRVFLDPEKTLYLNFNSFFLKNMKKKYEKKFIFSFYKTIYKNFKNQVYKVVITVDGRQFPYLKGGYYYPPSGFPL